MTAYDELMRGEDGTGLKFEVYEDKADQWRWRLRNARGEIIAVSGDSHRQAQHCETEIMLVRMSKNASIDGGTGLEEILKTHFG